MKEPLHHTQLEGEVGDSTTAPNTTAVPVNCRKLPPSKKLPSATSQPRQKGGTRRGSSIYNVIANELSYIEYWPWPPASLSWLVADGNFGEGGSLQQFTGTPVVLAAVVLACTIPSSCVEYRGSFNIREGAVGREGIVYVYV